MNTLWEALDRLEDGTRWKKYVANENGFRCILGAIGNASESDNYIDCTNGSEDAVASVAGVIKGQFPDRLAAYPPDIIPLSVCRIFNDHEDTTWEDVRLVLEKAAVSQDEILS